MQVKHLSSYPCSKWSGGETRELCIFPPGKIYQEQSFDYRISSATITAVESTFTPLPTYRRVLLSLAGEVTLRHHEAGTMRQVTLAPFEQDTFSGANQTTSQGTCVDFNVMTKVPLTSQVRVLTENETTRLVAGNHYFYYATQACELIVSSGNEQMRYSLREGEALHLIDLSAGDSVELRGETTQKEPFLLEVVIQYTA